MKYPRRNFWYHRTWTPNTNRHIFLTGWISICFCNLAAFRMTKNELRRVSNCITSTLCVIHRSSGDSRGLIWTHETLPGAETRLEVTQRAWLADLQPIQRVTTWLTLPCKYTDVSPHCEEYSYTEKRLRSDCVDASYLCTLQRCGSACRPWTFPQGRTYTPADPPGPGRHPTSSSHTRYVPGRSTFPPDIGLRQHIQLMTSW